MKKFITDKVKNIVLKPFNDIIDENVTDIVTTLGNYAVKFVNDRYQRKITFVTDYYTSEWIDTGLYNILSKYNNIKTKSSLEIKIGNKYRETDINKDSKIIWLGSGTHHLKYRNYNIILIIENIVYTTGGSTGEKKYTIITYDLDNQFVVDLEKDLITERDYYFKLNPKDEKLTIYRILNESKDGDELVKYQKLSKYTPKRRLSSIYIPNDQKKLLVSTINNFISSKKEYEKHGVSHTLKILLESPPACGKDSIIRMIATEWNRSLCFIDTSDINTIPNLIKSINNDIFKNPLIVISDIDKYPSLITDTDVDVNDKDSLKEKSDNKILFGEMINALDGMMNGENKIIIMSTNHIEKFSPVFLRPGRIDLIMHLDYTTSEVFRKYYHDIFGEILPKDIKLKDKELTISKLQFDILFQKMNKEEFLKKYVK